MLITVLNNVGCILPRGGWPPNIGLCDARRGRWDMQICAVLRKKNGRTGMDCVLIEAKASGMPLTQIAADGYTCAEQP